MKIHPLFLFTGLGMIVLAIIFVISAHNNGAALYAIFLGVLAWVISVGLKFAWALPTNKRIIKFFEKRLPSVLSGPVAWGYLGILTGVFECGIALLFVLNVPLLKQADWNTAIGFGVGFGAMEAFILGMLSFVHVSYYQIHPVSAKENKQWRIFIKYKFTAVSTAIVERASTIFVHTFTKVLIVIAVQNNMYLFFWFSFVFKSLVDAIAAWAVLKKNIQNWTKPSQIWRIEFIFIIFGILSIFGLVAIKNML